MTFAWSLGLWPSLRNPAWRDSAAAQAALHADLAVTIRPTRVRRKLDAAAMAPIKARFLVDGLGNLPTQDIDSLYTYLDMADVATHGDDLAATRLYRWLMASWEAGRPVQGRGQVFDSSDKIFSYCRSNLDLFRSMKRNGYSYSGPDEICFGIAADGEILHMRRGTHRMAAAQILELPSVSGRITHLDRSFAARAVIQGKERGSGSVAGILGAAIQEVARQTLA